MVFQSYALWPHMTITKNLALPLNIRKIPKAKQKTLIHDALDKVGLADLSGRYPHQLSGGQQQRVALARALVYSPTMLLLDEPLSNLDAKLREQARAWLKRLQEDLGITTVYVTHDQDEALALSDRIAVMSGGHMLQVADPARIYEAPATPRGGRVRRPMQLPHRARSRTPEAIIHQSASTPAATSSTVERRPATSRGQAVTVAIRPEKPGGRCRRRRTRRRQPPQHGGAHLLLRRLPLRVRRQASATRSSRSRATGRGLAGTVQLVFEPAQALLYTEKVELTEEERDLLTVNA